MLGFTSDGNDPLKVQPSTAKRLEKLIKGAPAEKLKKRPAPEKWSVQEILAHLADAEIVGSWRIRSILGAPGTPIQAFDQDAWVTAGHYSKRDARHSVAQFRILREANLGLYKSQPRSSGSSMACIHNAAKKPCSTSRPESHRADRKNFGAESEIEK